MIGSFHRLSLRFLFAFFRRPVPGLFISFFLPCFLFLEKESRFLVKCLNGRPPEITGKDDGLTTARPTRGEGALEGFLGRMRARMADRLIPEGARRGRILDVGCGTSPLFLLSTRFSEKHGLDKSLGGEVASQGETLHIRRFDIERESALPYADGTFDVVTMLAVFEHIEPARLPAVMGEVRRVLKDGGLLILTTPAAWTDGLLRMLSRVGLVSPEEINEHKDVYTHAKVRAVLSGVGFGAEKMRFGRFEAGMNLWIAAVK